MTLAGTIDRFLTHALAPFGYNQVANDVPHSERHLWHGADAARLRTLTIRWIQGELNGQPSYPGRADGPDGLETATAGEDLRLALVTLNTAGFLTENSSAAIDDGYIRTQAWISGFCDDHVLEQIYAFCLNHGYAWCGYAPVQRTVFDGHVTYIRRRPIGRPQPRFSHGGHSAAEIAFLYGMCGDTAVTELQGMNQVVIYDPEWGVNTLFKQIDEELTARRPVRATAPVLAA